MYTMQQELLDPNHDLVKPLPCLEIRKEVRPVAPHSLAVPIHHGQIGSDMRSEIDFVDYQEIRSGNSRSTFAWDLIAGCHIDHVNHFVRKFRAECRGQIVAAAFYEHQLGVGMTLEQIVQRFLIVRSVFTDRRMRTTSGLYAEDAILRECAPARKKLGILLGKNVIGDHRQTHTIAQTKTERFCLAAVTRPLPQKCSSDRCIEINTYRHIRSRPKQPRFQSAVPHGVNILNRRPRLKPLLMRRVVTDSFDHFDPTLQ